MMAPTLLWRVNRAEGAALAAVVVLLYWAMDGSWTLFAALALAPDICFVAFAAGRRAGVMAYNVFHTLAVPLLLGGAGVLLGERLPVLVALVWCGHIGVDRACGFGLKEA